MKLNENGVVFNTYYIIKCSKSRENIGADHCSCNFEFFNQNSLLQLDVMGKNVFFDIIILCQLHILFQNVVKS